MKKISTIFLLATIIACFLIGVPTFANEVDGNDPEPVGEEYAGISNLSFNLSISNAGNATIHFTLGVTSGYSADYELILLRDNVRRKNCEYACRRPAFMVDYRNPL